MQSDKKLEQLFKSNKSEIQDQGFSNDVINKLPEKINILPQIIIIFFALVGIVILIAIQGVHFFSEDLNNVIATSCQMGDFSIFSLTSYFSIVLIVGSVSYAVYQSDNI